MLLARSCIAWLHATLCNEHADEGGAKSAEELGAARDGIFVQALLPHQSLQVVFCFCCVVSCCFCLCCLFPAHRRTGHRRGECEKQG